ncbi:hypothetical protein L209DRAFT_756563 [Thermothelomyces heterothallicus CBS 203.75]
MRRWAPLLWAGSLVNGMVAWLATCDGNQILQLLFRLPPTERVRVVGVRQARLIGEVAIVSGSGQIEIFIM